MLVIAATHIGDIEDIPTRSINEVRQADVLVFEEDRPARQVLKKAGVFRDYYKYNEQQGIDQEVYDRLVKGDKVLYMSDQGTANLADPGKELLAFAHKNSVPIKVIPGPSSITAALSACPFSTQQFYYRGFLPKKSQERVIELKRISSTKQAVVILDTPYRLKSLLTDLGSTIGKGRKALLALDISGPKEDFIYANIHELEKFASAVSEKLNFVLILSPK